MILNLAQKVGVEGFFRLKVYKADGTFTGKDTGWCHNLITDIGLDALASQTDCLDWYHVGTGITPAAVTDTWLSAHQASSNDAISNTEGISGTSYAYRRQTIRFAVGTATGNMSEVGVGWSASTGTLFMHELIRNAAGDAITITVLADEFLEFTYELRYNIPAGDFTGTGFIGATEYNYTMRAAVCTSTARWTNVGRKIDKTGSAGLHYAYTGALGPITSVPSGQSGTYTTTTSRGGYNPGQKWLTFTVSADTTEWNIAGGVFRCLQLCSNMSAWQISFAKVSDGTGVPKTGSNGLTINWKLYWDRA